MSIRCVLTEPAFPCARTGRVDISGLHVLTFSVQVIALPQKILYRYNLGKISMPRIPTHLRETHWDAGSRSFNGRGVCASWIVCAGS